MTRSDFIEQIRRQIYNGYVPDDATITVGLVNQYLDQGIGIAAKQNYKENAALEAVGFVNNTFYSKFKGLPVSNDGNFLSKITLPQLPLGIGYSEGIGTLEFVDSNGNVSLPCVPISENQIGYFQTMRPIPNKILFFPEGTFIYAKSTLQLFRYTANVRMISGGNSADLTSVLNVPPDYISVIISYIQQQLILERNQPRVAQNDGTDSIKTT